jgi:hypothetical protein
MIKVNVFSTQSLFVDNAVYTMQENSEEIYLEKKKSQKYFSLYYHV